VQQLSPSVSQILEETTSFQIFAEALMEVELNGYVDYTVDFPESLEPNMFPADEVLKVRRPDGGLPKLVTPFGSFQSTEINDLCYTKSNNWYRFPSKDSAYKYYRTRTVAREGPNFSFESPLEFVVEYDQPLTLNKLVLGFEYSTALPEEVDIFFYSNEDWNFIGSYEVDDLGKIVITYDGSWSEYDGYTNDFTTLEKIKIVVASMKSPGGAVEIIQISPRLAIDVTDRIISVSTNQDAQDQSVIAPIGISSSNSATLQLSNNDGFFDNNNQDSPMLGLIDVNIKFTIGTLVGAGNEEFETVPATIVFANSWNFTTEGTVDIECSDSGKFLQSRSMEDTFYENRDIRFVIADILERAEVTNYKICFTQEDVEAATPYFFFENEQTVWDSLQQIATAEQAFFYFDEEGRFVWNSRDYWWLSQDVNYEILARSDGQKLANLESYSVQYTNVVNKAIVSYTPTNILKQGEKYVNNFLWEQSEPEVLRASPLLSKITDDSDFFLINERDFIFFPQEGIVNIDAEYIRFSKKDRPVKGNIEQTSEVIEKYINKMVFIVQDAAERSGVGAEDVEIVYAQERVWPDTSIGLRLPFRSYSNIFIEGFFVILKVPSNGEGQDILQYNSSLTANPFLAAVATSQEDLDVYSYWTIDLSSSTPTVVFTEDSRGFVPPSALYIEERGVFNSSRVDHSFGVGEDAEFFTFNSSPPEVVSEPRRIVFETVENSKLKLRNNTINRDLINHYSPNRPGVYDIYGAQFEFPLTFEEDEVGYEGQGIAGIFVNKTDPETGYYIEFTNSAYARKTIAKKREVIIWKYNPDYDPEPSGEDELPGSPRLILVGFLPEDAFLLSLEELNQVAGVPTDIFPGLPYKANVFTKNTQKRVYLEDGGENWDLSDTPGESSWRSVAYGDGVWVAVAFEGDDRVMRSTDNGATWTAVEVPEKNSWFSVAYGGGVFVAVSEDGENRVIRSEDNGETWESVQAAAEIEWCSIAYGRGVWVAVSRTGDNQIMRSFDEGRTWSIRKSPQSNSWRSVTYGKGIFVAVAASGTRRVMRSLDGGYTWTTVEAAEQNTWRDVKFGNGVWLAVASTGDNRVMKSTDGGSSWQAISVPESSWLSIAYGNNTWVAVGAGSDYIMKSVDDGETWEIIQAPSEVIWGAVSYAEGRYVAVASTGAQRAMVSQETPEIRDAVNISVALNGRRVLAIDDIEDETNNIYREGDWGVFARSNTAVDFEYVYAIKRRDSVFGEDEIEEAQILDKSSIAIRDQITGGYVDNTLEFYLDEENELRHDFVFEDFGGWAREIIEFDVQHEIRPSISSQLFISNESKVFLVNANLNQFSSKFAIGNRTRDFVVLAGDDIETGSNMVLSVFGIPLNRSEVEQVERINERSLWRRGEEEFVIESPWIQTKEKAERIADWVVQRWSSPSEYLDVSVIVDPRVQVGDVVTITIPENSITPETHKFHVVSLSRIIGESSSMSLNLRRAHF
jgi:hypothetical protein